MSNLRVVSIVLLAGVAWLACAPKAAPPFANGPVMSQKDIGETFKPILDFIGVKPGITFADVGAGSGAITVMMSTLMDKSVIYIQDIDTAVLKTDNVEKIIAYYSTQTSRDLRSTNQFHLTIGDYTHTNLPDGAFDLIYTNATMHVFDSPDTVLADISRKLKPDGLLFVRDSFKGDHGQKGFCADPKCSMPLMTIETFLEMMKRNRYKLVKQSPDMSGYPVFGFDFEE